MADAPLVPVLRGIRKLLGLGPAEQSADAVLLEQFTSTRDEAAFAALMERHGPLVWGICRRVLRNSLSTGESITFTYRDAERRTTATDASGRVTTFCYDAERRYTGYIDAQGHHYRFDLDAYGNRLAVIDPLGRATRYHYDVYGNAVRVQAPDGAVQRRVFDAEGRYLREVADALDRHTRYQHDARGNLIAIIAADGSTTAALIRIPSNWFATSSMAAGSILCPLLTIRSFSRPVSTRRESSVRYPRSPVLSQPSASSVPTLWAGST